jgi:hypothetical protein
MLSRYGRLCAGILSAAALVPLWCAAQATVNENLETAFVYVDGTSGSDNNPGTQQKPFKTIGKAASVAQTNNQNNIGTRVTINPGTYRENISLNHSSKDTTWPITFEAATNGTVIVSGAEVYTGWVLYSGNSNIYTHSWTKGLTLCGQINGCPTALDIVQRQELIAVNGAVMTQVPSVAAMQPGTMFPDTTAGTVYLWPQSGVTMSTATVEAGTHATVFGIHKKQDIVVRGLVFQYSNACRGVGAVEVDGASQNILFDTDVFQWNNGQGLSITNPTTYFTVENSSALHNGDSGFHADETDFGLWQSDVSSYNNWRGALGGYYNCNVSGLHFYGPHDDTLTDVTASYNQAFGVHWDTDDANISTTNLISDANLLNGVFIENSQGPFTFAGASICNQNAPILATAGMAFRNTTGVSLTNSTVINNAATQINFFGDPGGVTFQTWDGGKTITAIDKDFTNTGNVIQANDGTQELFQIPTLDSSDWTTFQSTLVSNTNTWWNPDSSANFLLPTSVNTVAVDFPTWQGDSGQDGNSVFNVPGGNPGSACTLTPDVPDFWLDADNYSVTTNAAGQAAFNLYLPSLNFSQTVNLTTDGVTEVSGLSSTLVPGSLVPTGSSVFTVSAGAGTAAGTYPVTVIGNSGNTTHAVTVDVVVPVTQVLLSTVSLTFASQNVGTPSPTQTVTLQNTGGTRLTITSIVASGAFSQTNTCGASVKANHSCTITVTFTPTAVGAATGAITITDADPTSPQVVNLSGTGVAPAVTLYPPTLTFPSQPVGTPSQPLTTTLSNVGSASLNINSISFSGANPGDFSQTNNCGSSVAVGASCSISVTFTPAASGGRAATLNVSDNTPEGTDSVNLTGTGSSITATLTPTSVDFGNQTVGTKSSPQVFTLTNTGSSNVGITNITTAGTNAADFSASNNCGATLKPGASCAISVTFTPSASGSRSANLSVTDNAGTGSQSASLTGSGTAVPTATLLPSSLSFGSVAVGTPSPPQTLTLTNTGTSSLNVTSIKITGSDLADYTQTNNCAGTLAAGTNCTITVTFTPITTGTRSASVTVLDNTSTGSQSASLSGTGSSSPTATLSPASLSFPSQQVGTTSPGQTLTLTNTGATKLTINSISITGANAGDFAQTHTCASALAAGASCTISVTFTPTNVGTRTATVTVSDNTALGSNTASLTGTGTSTPTATLTPASLTFASQTVGVPSPAQVVTLTNTGLSSLTINSIKITGANRGDYSQTNTCGSSLAAGATCTISVVFDPTTTGTRTATLTVSNNTTAGSNSSSLTGTGSSATPSATLTPSSLTFAAQAVGTPSPAQTLTLTNTGTVSLTITSIKLTGADPGDYSQTNTCGATLAAAATCTINVVFDPAKTGTRTATLTVSDNTSAGANSSGLTGTGATPTASLTPSSLTFASQQVGIPSPAQTLTLTNTGSVTLTITSIKLTGANPGDYSQTSTCGATLAASATCTISVVFDPTKTGTRTATVTVTDNIAAGSNTASLTGTGSSTSPTATLTPSSLTFAAQAVGTTSASQALTLSNTGTLTLSISSVALTGTNPGDYAQTNTCGSTLAVGKTCTITVTFTPTASGTRTATVTVTDNTASGSQTTSLTGTGAYPTITLTPSSLNFGTQTVGTKSAGQTITVTNTGTVILTFGPIKLTGTDHKDYSQTNTCGTTLGVGKTCSITVTFTPAATGTRTASVSVSGNTSEGTDYVTLTGTGS